MVIVGGGLSGLTAARMLRDEGRRVRVLEARSEVGGRTMDWRVAADTVAEGGAQWVGGTQHEIQRLAAELGVEVYPATVPGRTRFHFDGLRFDTAGEETSAEVQELRAKLDAIAATVPLDAPWQAPEAEALDARTVGQWLARQGASADAETELSFSIATFLGDVRELSLLYLAFYIASAGSFEALEAEAQSHRLAGGPQQLCRRMADALGDSVSVSTPVLAIEHKRELVRVATEEHVITARHVIVAMPPSDAKRIRFAPPLPELRANLHRDWICVPGAKQHLVYDEPFWRNDGLSGTAITDFPITAFATDASPPTGGLGVLVVFPNEEALPPTREARRAELVREMTALFGERAATPVAYFEKNWAEERWISGCVSPLPPGVLTQSGPALRAAVGRIHWAGTETSERWCGYMEGAIVAGQRAAREVDEALTASG
ncbi:MAG: FAD-dependent oxidoreductase [Myxococcota bacterium]